MSKLALHVEDSGERELPTVLFLHAFPLDRTMYAAQSRALEGRARRLLIDYPGVGKSPSAPSPLFFEHLVDAVLELLKQHCPSRVTVVGVSMGGYLALRMAEKAPETIRALLLCGTHSLADSDAQKLKRALSTEAVDADLPSYAKAFVSGALSKHSLETQPELAARLIDAISCTSPHAIQTLLLAMASRTDTTRAAAALACPLRLVAGAEDSLIPLSLMESMQMARPGTRLEVIEKAGHLMNLEAPERFNEILLEFLNELET